MGVDNVQSERASERIACQLVPNLDQPKVDVQRRMCLEQGYSMTSVAVHVHWGCFGAPGLRLQASGFRLQASSFLGALATGHNTVDFWEGKADASRRVARQQGVCGGLHDPIKNGASVVQVFQPANQGSTPPVERRTAAAQHQPLLFLGASSHCPLEMLG